MVLPCIMVYGVEGHVRGAHDVPWIVKTANMEQFIPPWTVNRQVWSDSLKAATLGDIDRHSLIQ